MSAPASRKRRWMSQIIVRLREREEVAVVQQILLRVLEALAADVRFRHAVGADGRAHRAVDDGDAFPQELLEGVFQRHGSLVVRRVPRCRSARVALERSGASVSVCVRPGFSASASTTCRWGFRASRQATSARETLRPARGAARAACGRKARVALAVGRGDLVLFVLVQAQQHHAPARAAAPARTPPARAPDARRRSACGRAARRRSSRRRRAARERRRPARARARALASRSLAACTARSLLSMQVSERQ